MPPRYSREIEQPIVMGDSLKDQFRTSPCEASCPAGNPIQKMQSLVEKGRFGEALRYLRARNPFPGVTGRVCPHFCQTKCNRDRLEGCVNTRALERAAYDHAPKGIEPFTRAPETGKHVAVVGGGPAGMTAAYFLSLLGHDVTGFPSAPRRGGPRDRLDTGNGCPRLCQRHRGQGHFFRGTACFFGCRCRRHRHAQRERLAHTQLGMRPESRGFPA